MVTRLKIKQLAYQIQQTINSTKFNSCIGPKYALISKSAKSQDFIAIQLEKPKTW